MAESEVDQEDEETEEESSGSSPEPLLDYDGAETMTEVYRTDNVFAADAVIADVLTPEGITAVRHDRLSHAFPAPASMPGAIGIAVPEAQAERARQLLMEARRDGVLSDDGEVFGGEQGTALA